MSISTRKRTAAAAVALAVAVTGAVGSAAQAASTLATSCVQSSGRPFLPWLDVAEYGLTPGGSFETTNTWSLSAGSKIVSGNESFYVRSSLDRRSLLLPKGAVATTPATCVGLGDPTVRLFAVARAGGTWLRVEAIGSTLLGQVVLPVALVPVGTSWAPTPPLTFLSGAAGLTSLDGTTTSVRFRFTAVGGDVRVDDVYVDPWKVH